VRPARRLAGPATAAIVALVVLLAVHPVSTSRAVGAWTLFLAALALLEVARGARTTRRPRRFEAALRRRSTPPAPPVDLERIQRQLELGVASADYAHRRLLPLLRAAAAGRLASEHGVDLARRPDRAQALLGDETWNLLRPDRPQPADRHAAGIPLRQIETAIERVESL
jgi:hypothetical protein